MRKFLEISVRLYECKNVCDIDYFLIVCSTVYSERRYYSNPLGRKDNLAFLTNFSNADLTFLTLFRSGTATFLKPWSFFFSWRLI